MGSSFEDLEVWGKCGKEAKELIYELKSISKMLQSLPNSLKKLWTVNRQPWTVTNKSTTGKMRDEGSWHRPGLRAAFQEAPSGWGMLFFHYTTWVSFRKQFRVTHPEARLYFASKTTQPFTGSMAQKMFKSSIWLIKAGHKVLYPDPDECDQYSYSATLTFEVK